ncbi:MAG: NAD(P)/FAD-dependent oxidoreductase [Anaerolineae bacterium]
MKIGIIGAGIAGLTAAYDLAGAGHEVLVWEAADQPGGLASGFRDEGWEWSMDRFYHHVFATDAAIIALSREIGAELFFRQPETVIWHRGTMEAFDSPLAVLRFSHLNLPDKLRTGAVIAYLRLLRNWQPLEGIRAEEWLRRWMGERAYRVLWQPQFQAKFGAEYAQVNMAWFWARISKRTKSLGYFVGGFQAFADRLAQAVGERGGRVLLGRPVRHVRPLANGCFAVEAGEASAEVERAIVTVGPRAALAVLPDLPEPYAGQLRALRSYGAMTVVLALHRPLTPKHYWISLSKEAFPFMAAVEHTNYIEPSHYGGDHLVYLGEYLLESDPRFRMSKEELLALYLPALCHINPRFDPSWVRKSWLFRESEAQPFTPVHHSRALPSLRTPVRGLYVAGMSQVYPWDRGTNYAVEMGREVAGMVAADDSPAFAHSGHNS